jgi:hypothetical protein
MIDYRLKVGRDRWPRREERTAHRSVLIHRANIRSSIDAKLAEGAENSMRFIPSPTNTVAAYSRPGTRQRTDSSLLSE